MKLSVLTDQTGRIIATQYVDSPIMPQQQFISKIMSSEGQLLHEVEIPLELQQHILQNTFATEIFKYKVEDHDKITKLVKLS
ncbi:hypothetical protein IIU_06614 [Bacillus cereus VD133]|uniref:Uncharacterized protein n=1 Tax=Bacillus cereus VD133 TaxID=1053233 RepID=A0A9W5PK04_BACCE|nr:hypothetical protein [Bacillus cereus]EOO24769.1 hypothetical protein IIU_06614 [Bacillus cereus VD133]